MSALARIIEAPFRAWDKLLFEEVDARRMAALRIGVGVFAFLTLWGLAPVVELHHSDGGWFPLHVALVPPGQAWTLLHAFASPFAARVFVGLAMCAAAALAVGWHSRIAAWATFIALVSFQHRCPLLNYGGDTTIKLLAFGVALGACGRAWSIDALLAKARLGIARSDRGETDVAHIRRRISRHATTPVWPLRLVQFQVATIYFWSGLAKLHGSTWHDGSALALALVNPQLARHDFSQWAATPFFGFVMKALTVTTLYWELFFCVLVLFRWGRWIALGTGTAIHLGIIGLMRIQWFGHIMIVSYISFIPGGALRSLALRVRRAGRARLARRRTRVIFDQDCALCRRTVVWISLLDWFRAVELIPLADARRWRRVAPRLGPADVRSDMIAVPAGGEPRRGLDAYRALGRVVPALAPVVVLCWIPGVAWLGRRIYAVVAANRYTIVASICDGEKCALPGAAADFTEAVDEAARPPAQEPAKRS